MKSVCLCGCVALCVMLSGCKKDNERDYENTLLVDGLSAIGPVENATGDSVNEGASDLAGISATDTLTVDGAAALDEQALLAQSPPLDSEVIYVGRFIDSSVEGLAYQTASRRGVTSRDGEFTYVVGETIEFFIGDISIGVGVAGSVLTPNNLVTRGEEYNFNHQFNVIRLLQTLDVDGEPTNGIKIRNDINDFNQGFVLDFDLPVDLFAELDDLALLLGETSNVAALVSEPLAISHYVDSLTELGIEIPGVELTTINLVGNLDAEERAPETRVKQIFSSGEDINIPQIGTGDNGYKGQKFVLLDSNGQRYPVIIEGGSSAESIAVTLSRVQGVDVTSSNSITIDFGPLASSNSWQFSFNGQSFPAGASMQEIAISINDKTNTTLPGISASIGGSKLYINANSGVNFNFYVAGGEVGTDSMSFIGNYNGYGSGSGRGDFGSINASVVGQVVTVGGFFWIEYDEEYDLYVESLFSSAGGYQGDLLPNLIVPTTVVTNGFDREVDDTFNLVTHFDVFDSLGYLHVLSLYFTKTKGENRWSVYVFIDDLHVGGTNPALPPPQDELQNQAKFDVVFNSDGSFDTQNSQTVFVRDWVPEHSQGYYNDYFLPILIGVDNETFLIENPSSTNFLIDLSGLTQFGSSITIGAETRVNQARK